MLCSPAAIWHCFSTVTLSGKGENTVTFRVTQFIYMWEQKPEVALCIHLIQTKAQWWFITAYNWFWIIHPHSTLPLGQVLWVPHSSCSACSPVRTMGSSNIGNRTIQGNKALKDLLAMVWVLKPHWTMTRGCPGYRWPWCRCSACTTIAKYFRSWHKPGWEVTCSTTHPSCIRHNLLLKNEMEDLPMESLMAAGQLPLRSPRAAGHGGDSERAWAPPETETGRENKTLTCSLPRKGYFRGIAPKHGARQAFILSNISIFFLQNQTFDVPQNPQQKWDFSLVWSHLGAYAALKQNTAW